MRIRLSDWYILHKGWVILLEDGEFELASSEFEWDPVFGEAILEGKFRPEGAEQWQECDLVCAPADPTLVQEDPDWVLLQEWRWWHLVQG